MKTLRHFFWLLAVAGLAFSLLGADTSATTPAVAAPATPSLATRFKQVRERIDTLFEHRNGQVPPIEPRTNPFRPPGTGAAPPPVSGDISLPSIPEPDAPLTNMTRLQEVVAAMKIGGTLEREGKLYLIINGKQYRDNDVIPTQIRGETIYPRLSNISRRAMTVTLDEAEISLKF